MHSKLLSALAIGATSLKIVSNTADITRFNLSTKMGWGKGGPDAHAKRIPFLSRSEMQSLAKSRLQIPHTSSNTTITNKANELKIGIVSEYTAYTIKTNKTSFFSDFLSSPKRNKSTQ
jgi:hypothetical protein